MRRIGVFLGIVSLVLLSLPVATQEEEANIARLVFFRAKPGMSQQLEDGMKKHMAWHTAQKDTWTWSVWSYVSGEESGMYGAGTFGHKWSDFDSPSVNMAADEADSRQTIMPYAAEGARWAFYASLPKVSKPVEGESPMHEILVFRPRMGKAREVNHLIQKFHEAIQKTNWPAHYEWYVLVNGGEGSEFVLVIPLANWAAMKGPAKSFPEMLEEAVGRQDAEAMLEQWDNALKSVSSTIARSRPELGYTPPKK